MGTSIEEAGREPRSGEPNRLVLDFDEIDAGMLALVGGKAANLGEMARAGFPVPPGCCVTTTAYTLVAAKAGLGEVIDSLALTPSGDPALAEHAADARDRLLAAAVPDSVVRAVADEYAALGDGEPVAVAVRSSATAEDLPFASFAGQQDTYLGVHGGDAVLDAVRRCWASLWTDRAVAYRASNGIDHRSVRLAVVIQRMVDARTAGVLFTANPLTGRRRQAVIEASRGLGEAVVSGAVNPDHFVVDPATGEILERRLGSSEHGEDGENGENGENTACVGDDELAALARLGSRVETHYGTPQDTEWAIDADGVPWLTQARPITTLYPLPVGAPPPDGEPRVYFSANVAQGVFRPLTPMGIQAMRLVGSAGATAFGVPPVSFTDGPPALVVAGGRLFLDATPAVRSEVGRRVLPRVLGVMEARSASVFQYLFEDPRLSVVHRSARPVLRRVVPAMVRHRTPLRAAATVLRPATARKRFDRLAEEIRAATSVPPGTPAAQRLDVVESAVRRVVGHAALETFAPVLLPYVLLHRLVRVRLGDEATEEELQIALRGVPYNPTTEMDLALWDVTTHISRDPAARRSFLETSPEDLATMYLAGQLPSTAQRELAGFLRSYGHRGVAEIDVGVPPWSEEPAHVLGAVSNYLRLDDCERPTRADGGSSERREPGERAGKRAKEPDQHAPDGKFERGRREGAAMVAEISRRASKHHPLRGRLVGFCLRRIREIAGLREMPKFNFILLFAGIREQLHRVGEDLAADGRLESAGDIFFVDLREAREATRGRDLRETVSARRMSYEREMGRRHIPRVLLSDGTDLEAALSAAQPEPPAADGTLTGTAASPGRVCAPARVILDPAGARLEPGEILVAPSTDPGWTPLFLTAGGLIMEMGGAMSHGAVVAREYGIPAVVGVSHATQRLETGQAVTLDGSSGIIVT